MSINSGARDTTFTSLSANFSLNYQNWLQVTSGDTIYTNLSGVIQRHLSDGSLDTGFTAWSGVSNSQAYYVCDDGSVIISKYISSFKQEIYKLNSDGTQDTGFTSTVFSGSSSGNIYSIGVQSDGKIIVGGGFRELDGVTVNHIARLNANGTPDYNFGYTGATGGFQNTTEPAVRGITIQANDKLIIFGFFTGYRSVFPTGGFCRLDADGVWVETFSGYPDGVNFRSLELFSDEKMLIVGGFTNFGSSTADDVVVLNEDGTVWSGFTGAGTGFYVSSGAATWYSAIDSNDRYAVVGRYTSYDGTATNRIGYFETDGTQITEFNSGGTGFEGASMGVYAVAFTNNNKILANSSYTQVYNNEIVGWLKVIRIHTITLNVPTVTTTNISNIEATTATSGGNISDDGGATVTSRGVCWSTGSTPTTGDTKTTDGSGTGIFVSSLTNLNIDTLYYVRAYAINIVGISYGNIESFYTIGLSPLPPLCEDTWENRLTVSAATCGNSDGIITINNRYYFDFYDIVLTDIQNNIYNFNKTTGEATGLTANYYFLTATPKPEFHNYYDGIICEFNWIPLPASDTTMTNDNISIRDATCGQFGASAGRIVYFGTDSGSTGSYDANMYNDEQELIQTVTGTTISQLIFTPLLADDYYTVITNNNNNCTLLLGMNQVKNIKPSAVAGIQRLFVTEWNNLIEYNYWSGADEDYFLSGTDPDFFTSIKIKEFIDSTLPTLWFEILLDTKGVTYQQIMNKTHQGFVFTDTITITIPHADNAKWKTLVDFLTNKYILVFKDNNNQWWVMGYRYGSKVDGYKRSNNEYILTLNAISDNKITTNIDETYVLNNIIA